MIKKPIVKKTKKHYMLLVCFGLVLMMTGIFAEKYGINSRFLGFGAGVGSAAIALGSAGLISLRRKPEDVRLQEVNENDERNIKIREKSAYGTFFVTLFGLSAVQIVFLCLNYMVPSFIIIGLMALHVISYFVLIYRNDKIL